MLLKHKTRSERRSTALSCQGVLNTLSGEMTLRHHRAYGCKPLDRLTPKVMFSSLASRLGNDGKSRHVQASPKTQHGTAPWVA
eukprot:5272688-Amphidinium_carterae.1